MSGDLLIDPLVLDPTDFPPLPLQPGFTQLVSDELVNAATPTDGFDNVVAETIALVDALDSALGSLAFELLDAFAEADSIDPAPVSDTAAGFDASLGVSSTAVDNLGTLLASASVPTPTGVGGGGVPPLTIGSATSPVLPCEARQGMGAASCSGYPCSASVNFINTLSTVMHVLSMTLVQPSGGPFTATTDCTGTLQPGASCRFTITLQAPAPPGSTAQLQIATDTPGSPHVFCVDTAQGSGGLGGGGGGGGPIFNPVA